MAEKMQKLSNELKGVLKNNEPCVAIPSKF